MARLRDFSLETLRVVVVFYDAPGKNHELKECCHEKKIILGAGISGLSAGMISGWPVYEAESVPGGICSSYYLRPKTSIRLHNPPDDEEVYRFETGGGHWIFGSDQVLLRFLESLISLKSYVRDSAVFFHDDELYVPYPLQNSLRFLDAETVSRSLMEMSQPQGGGNTMKQWLERSFGPTLCDRFFHPFHQLYTAGLFDRIAPQDPYKSPIDLSLVISGALTGDIKAAGYNATFVYPVRGLNCLANEMAKRSDIRYNKRVTKIDVIDKMVSFEDGTDVSYEIIISTLPLNKMLAITGLKVDATPDPYSSVLVLNIGARRGKNCPRNHWLYNFNTKARFHRVGFYSHVDASFLPKSSRDKDDRVAIYVECAFPGGVKPSKVEIDDYIKAVSNELQQWDYIGQVEVADPTWIDVAYTWSWPQSKWKSKALKALEKHAIYQVGRYGQWKFQGIAKSITDGFCLGASLRW